MVGSSRSVGRTRSDAGPKAGGKSPTSDMLAGCVGDFNNYDGFGFLFTGDRVGAGQDWGVAACVGSYIKGGGYWQVMWGGGCAVYARSAEALFIENFASEFTRWGLFLHPEVITGRNVPSNNPSNQSQGSSITNWGLPQCVL